jgi:hypothetical protein
MSGDNGRQRTASTEATNGNETTEADVENNTASEQSGPLSGALAGLAMLVEQQQQQQHLQALIQQARTMQQANMILHLNAQLQQQQLAQQGLPASALALSLASTAASNFHLPTQINLSMTPQPNALSAVFTNPMPNAATSLQDAVAMLANAANVQQLIAQMQHQTNQNHLANAARMGSAAAGVSALGVQSPHFQTGVTNASDYHLLAGLGLPNDASQYTRLGMPSTALEGLGIPRIQSQFAIDSARSGSATASQSLGNTSTSAPAVAAMSTQLPTILSLLQQHQQVAAAAQTPASAASIQRAPDVPSSINSSATPGESGTFQLESQRETSTSAPSAGPLTMQQLQSGNNVPSASSLPSGPGVAASAPALTNRPPVALHLEEDSHSLNAYQCLLRKQIELFETAPTSGVEGRSQGRNTPIRIGQVGIRCRHCATLPNKARPKGAVYYSKSLDGVYQVSQNMSKVHLTERCRRIPNSIKQRLISLHSVNRRASGGKPYWVDGLRQLGVYEDGPILRFLPVLPRRKENTGNDDNGQNRGSR